MSEWLSAQDTVRRIVQGELTAAGALDVYLARIDKLDGQFGAYLAVDAEGARAQAAEIDRKRKAGEPLGPLAGVPIALKDVLVTKDLATTAA
jgi:aspartyl-tRNA(Asn)/glutamyl-tRNA(Gln) amidotransferase subunit A